MDNEKTFTFDQLLDGLGPIIFESIKIPFGIFGKNHKVLWCNDALAMLHQVSSKELIGNICYQVCRNKTKPCQDCHIQNVWQTGKIQIVEKWYEFPGRKKVWGEVHYYPVRGNDDKLAAVILFGFDVTDRKNRLEVLKNYSKYLSGKLNLENDEYQKIRTGSDKITINVKLSNREKEVLRMLTESYTNAQLSTSINTVKTHVSNIFNKFGVNDRTQAAVYLF